MEATHTSYLNGTIRDASGKLIAHWDSESKALYIDGIPQTLYALDNEHAMDLVAQHHRA